MHKIFITSKTTKTTFIKTIINLEEEQGFFRQSDLSGPESIFFIQGEHVSKFVSAIYVALESAAKSTRMSQKNNYM